MKNFSLFAAGFVAGFAALFVLILIFGDYEDEPAATPTNAVVAQEVATAAPTGLAYETVCEADTNNMTDPQIAAFAQQHIGETFTNWQGWVYDVESRADGTYNLLIAMQARDLFWSRNIVIENIPTDLATSLNVEQPITFSGRIARNEPFLEVICNPLVVDNYSVQQ